MVTVVTVVTVVVVMVMSVVAGKELNVHASTLNWYKRTRPSDARAHI